MKHLLTGAALLGAATWLGRKRNDMRYAFRGLGALYRKGTCEFTVTVPHEGSPRGSFPVSGKGYREALEFARAIERKLQDEDHDWAGGHTAVNLVCATGVGLNTVYTESLHLFFFPSTDDWSEAEMDLALDPMQDSIPELLP